MAKDTSTIDAIAIGVSAGAYLRAAPRPKEHHREHGGTAEISGAAATSD